MQKIKLELGVLSAGERSGEVRSIRRVQFTGEDISGTVTVDRDQSGARGQSERLYLLPDGRYRLYRKHWSQWGNEITEAELSAPFTKVELYESGEMRPAYATLEAANLLQVEDLDGQP